MKFCRMFQEAKEAVGGKVHEQDGVRIAGMVEEKQTQDKELKMLILYGY